MTKVPSDREREGEKYRDLERDRERERRGDTEALTEREGRSMNCANLL